MLLRQPKTQLQPLNRNLEGNYYLANQMEGQKGYVVVVTEKEKPKQPWLCQEVVAILAVEAEKVGKEIG